MPKYIMIVKKVNGLIVFRKKQYDNEPIPDGWETMDTNSQEFKDYIEKKGLYAEDPNKLTHLVIFRLEGTDAQRLALNPVMPMEFYCTDTKKFYSWVTSDQVWIER